MFSNLLEQLIAETTLTSLCHFAPELVLSATIVVLLLLRLCWSIDRWIPAYVTALAGALVALGFSGFQLLNLLDGQGELSSARVEVNAGEASLRIVSDMQTVRIVSGASDDVAINPDEIVVTVSGGEGAASVGAALAFLNGDDAQKTLKESGLRLHAVILDGSAETKLPGDGISATLEPHQHFGGLLVFDQFGAFIRGLLALFLVLVIALTVLTGIPDAEDGPDFYTLLFGATIGMMLMASANHLLMFFLGIEMASVPSYVMVGFLKGRRESSEAAFKYVVYGAGAAGVMLYGISLLCGLLGTASIPDVSAQLGAMLSGEGHHTAAEARTALLAVLMVFVGIAFKLSLVPFHFWCPDAFQGASAEVAGFLSVASKGAAFALLVRFSLALTGGIEAASETLVGVGVAIGVIAGLTVTFGNLAAYGQSNIKRLLAYSTIAHAGYMLMAVSALVVIQAAGSGVAGFDVAGNSERCVEGLLFYLFVYLFMNLGAFAVVALIRNETFSEEIDSYNGIGWEAPVLCSCMVICMFSLVGLPPFGGFWGKLVIFASLFQAGHIHWFLWVLLVIAGLNTVFSLFYYIRVLKAMFIRPRAEGARRVDVPASMGNYALLIAVPVLLLGLLPNSVTELARTVSRSLFE
jgi:NADH-quinone oxidoreductase subunit N